MPLISHIFPANFKERPFKSNQVKKSVSLFCMFVLMVTFSRLALAQDTWIPLYPEGIPCTSDLEMEIVEKDIGQIISKVQKPEMLVYPAKVASNTGSAIVICPGGGYTVLAWDWEGTKIAAWFQELGVTAFVLRYRLPHWESEACKSKVALMDVQRAMRTVRLKANEYGIDPEKIGVMGFSAGGHLASTLSTHFDEGNSQADLEVEKLSCRPNFSILMYPVITMDTVLAHTGSRKNLIGDAPTSDMELFFSNEKQITESTPPTLLIHADDDQVVIPENSVRYYLGLRKNGVPAALHIYESGGHGFSFAEGQGSVEGWRKVCQDWMLGLHLLTEH